MPAVKGNFPIFPWTTAELILNLSFRRQPHAEPTRDRNFIGWGELTNTTYRCFHFHDGLDENGIQSRFSRASKKNLPLIPDGWVVDRTKCCRSFWWQMKPGWRVQTEEKSYRPLKEWPYLICDGTDPAEWCIRCSVESEPLCRTWHDKAVNNNKRQF